MHLEQTDAGIEQRAEVATHQAHQRGPPRGHLGHGRRAVGSFIWGTNGLKHQHIHIRQLGQSTLDALANQLPAQSAKATAKWRNGDRVNVVRADLVH